jgi:NADP-dependent 3-hydroxy acid dehydrogenase YdfG
LRKSLYLWGIPGNEEPFMDKPEYRSALIVGTGPGLSASLARLFAGKGLAVSLAARQTDKLAALAKETGAEVHACNAADQ